MSEAIIQSSGVSKQFNGAPVVDDLTFEIPRGVIFGFVGPSGAGKTTTVRLLTGVYQPSAGHMSVLGSAPDRFTRRTRERIGYMPQLTVLYPDLTVWENLNFVASIYGMSWFRRKRLNEVLDFVELKEHKRKRMDQLSGGMQRRASLAAALAHQPDLIFLDEPTAGVDPMLRIKFWDYFRKKRDTGCTFFITTQYVSEAAYCDLVGVLSAGRLIALDTPDNLRRQSYGGDLVDLNTDVPLDYRHIQQLRRLPCVIGAITPTSETSVRLVVDEAGTAIPMLLDWGREQDIAVNVIEEYHPPFDDVFVQLVKENEAVEHD